LTVKHLKRRSTGLYYFRRGIPKDLRDLYKGKLEQVHSLKTSNESEAIKKCQALTSRYDKEFQQLRSTGDRTRAAALLESYNLAPIPLDDQFTNDQIGIEGNPYDELLDGLAFKHDQGGYFSPREKYEQRALDILQGNEKLTLEEIREAALKGVVVKAGRDIQLKKKQQEIVRFFNYFTEVLPVTQIDLIRRKQVQDAVDKLLDDGKKTGTVRKALVTVRRYVRKAIALHELNLSNPFDGVEIKGLGLDISEKEVFDSNQLSAVKFFIVEKSDLTTAQVLGLLVDTGTRCGEVGGITLEDIRLDHAIPHLRYRALESRDVKTKSSEREMPLVGLSLEVAKKIKSEAQKGQVYAFPQWIKGTEFSHTGCSNAVNKLLQTKFKNHSTHCFRHTMNDRLKDADVRGDIINAICGWSGQSMQDNYGQTQRLKILRDALLKVLGREAIK
jgi:integrase